MEIELYLKSEKDAVKGAGRENLPPIGFGGGFGKQNTSWYAKTSFIGFPEKGARIKKLLEEIASKHNYELIIYDISNKPDAKTARAKGIHKTPTVIIDNHRFEDDFEAKDIITHIFGSDASKAGYKDENKKYICPKCQSDNIKIYEDLSGFCNACNEPFMKGYEASRRPSPKKGTPQRAGDGRRPE